VPTVTDKKAMQAENSQSEKVPFWLDPKKRAIVYQIGTLCMVGLLAYYLVSNTLTNLEKQSVATGFFFYRDYLNGHTRHLCRYRALINELVGIQTGGDLH
jgi:ABC-type amino acid transport system permease subunit